jgi:DNA-binding CsgD family transcriptional regulator
LLLLAIGQIAAAPAKHALQDGKHLENVFGNRPYGVWCTPKANKLLAELFPDAGAGSGLPPLVTERLKQLRLARSRPAARSSLDVGTRRLELSFLSSLGPDELLFRLTELTEGADENLLQKRLELTTRESQVLLWISRGKSNREIGEILKISPRTVNKHLEQVFEKLGVENRAAAAARAVGCLS